MSRSTVLIAGQELASYGFPNGHPFGMDRYGAFMAEAQRSASFADLDPRWLASTFTYASVVDGRRRSLPAGVAAVHMFNHGIHHRGQLTTLMKQAGVDPGVTDLPWLPGLTRTD